MKIKLPVIHIPRLPFLAKDSSKRFVSPKTLLLIAWRTLVARKLRTFLTIFGIIVGIGAIFFLLSFGLGLRNLVTKEVIGDTSIKAIDVSTPNSKILHLDSEMINKTARLPHVEQVSKSFSYPGILSYKGSETDTVAYGVDGSYAHLNAFNLVAGRAITDADEDAVVVNRAVLRVLAQKDDKSLIGQLLKIVVPLQNTGASKKQIEKEFKVVGVIDTSTGPEVFIANGMFEGAGVRNYSQLKVVADDAKNVTGLRKQIESMGYQTTSPIDTLDQINEVFRIFTFVLVGFGAIGMIVAVLGMFNTLTISLIERTKEIGLMIALGARSRDMFRLFVFEALLLSLSGAIVGILCAIFASVVINAAMNGFARSRGVAEGFQLFSYPLWLIGAMIAFMLLVGFLVVLFPARRARRINPIDALRRE